MISTPLPTQLLIEPHIVNMSQDGDDSDPQTDICLGFNIGYRSSEGWHHVYYGSPAEVLNWLSQHGYDQVSCTSKRYLITGKYAKTEQVSA
jgi:hypothetical protein